MKQVKPEDTFVEDACSTVAMYDTMDSVWNTIEALETRLRRAELPHNEALHLRIRLKKLHTSYVKLERAMDTHLGIGG